jgi:flagellar motor switch protein FliG
MSENKEASNTHHPFDFIKRCDPNSLLTFLQYELPQTIAVVLSFLEPIKAAVILKSLDDELQSEIISRIAFMDWVSPEILREIERVIEKKLSSLSSEADYDIGGVNQSVKLLSLVDKKTEKRIFENLKSKRPELADYLKKKLLKQNFFRMLKRWFVK